MPGLSTASPRRGCCPPSWPAEISATRPGPSLRSRWPDPGWSGPGVEAFEGTEFADILGGDDNVNRLSGLGGNDELVGRDGAFDLVERGAPWDEPRQRGLTPDDVMKMVT